MIRTIGQLLARLQEAEIQQIERAGITHAPTIGEMYEGLTSSILEKSLPLDADLKVVSGFVEHGCGGQSGQIDCMLVSGDGKPIPHSKSFKWPVKDVHAVLEIKKRLLSKELADAHNQLTEVLNIYGQHILSLHGNDKFDIEPSLYAFGQISGRVPPAHCNAGSLPFDLEMLYRTLIVEQLSPIRIVFGYGGYKSEFSFRQAFVRLLRKNIRRRGFGAGSLPQLTVCGHYSLIKLNGHPYSTPMRGGQWLILASANENPLIFLLQVIWTRLSYKFQMPEPFYNDLDLERVSPLLSCRAVRRRNREGWAYTVISVEKKSLLQDVPQMNWRPFEVSMGQFIVLNELCRRTTLPMNDLLISEMKAREPGSLKDLIAKRLVALDGSSLVLLTRKLRCAIMPTGELVAGDDSGGRMTAWVDEQMEKIRGEATP